MIILEENQMAFRLEAFASELMLPLVRIWSMHHVASVKLIASFRAETALMRSYYILNIVSHISHVFVVDLSKCISGGKCKQNFCVVAHWKQALTTHVSKQ